MSYKIISILDGVRSAVGTPCARCDETMFFSNGGGRSDLSDEELSALHADARRRGQDVSRRHISRHLCSVCYPAVHRAGKLDDYPRMQRSRDEVMALYAHLREKLGPSATLATIAREMDLPRTTLSQTLKRAYDAEDERSDYTGRRGPRTTGPEVELAARARKQKEDDDAPTPA